MATQHNTADRSSREDDQPTGNQSPNQIADSPWLWLLLFSVMALVALGAIHGKYSRRQAAIELKSQGREAVMQRVAGNDGSEPLRPRAATPLWVIAVFLTSIAVFAAVKLRLAIRRGDRQ